MSKIIKNIREIIKFPKTCKELVLPRISTYDILKEWDVDLAGISKLRSGYEIQRDAPNFHLIIFTISGNGIFNTAKKKYILKKGSLMISPAGLAQHYYPADNYWRKFWFHLKDSAHWEYLKSQGYTLKNAINPTALLYAMNEFASEQLHNMPNAAQLTRAYGDIICAHLSRELTHSFSSAELNTRQAITRLLNEISEHLSTDWTIASLAKIAGISAPHLSRLCVKYYKLSPLRIVTKLRMLKAAELLKTTSWKLNMIAESLGYKNQFAFSTAFKHFYSLSPKAFKHKSNMNKK